MSFSSQTLNQGKQANVVIEHSDNTVTSFTVTKIDASYDQLEIYYGVGQFDFITKQPGKLTELPMEPGVLVGTLDYFSAGGRTALSSTGNTCQLSDNFVVCLKDKPATGTLAYQAPSSGDPAASWRQQATLLLGLSALAGAAVVCRSARKQSV